MGLDIVHDRLATTTGEGEAVEGLLAIDEAAAKLGPDVAQCPAVPCVVLASDFGVLLVGDDVEVHRDAVDARLADERQPSPISCAALADRLGAGEDDRFFACAISDQTRALSAVHVVSSTM